jgi:hypothetical protein
MGSRTSATLPPQSSCRSSPRSASGWEWWERPQPWGSALGDCRPFTWRWGCPILPPDSSCTVARRPRGGTRTPCWSASAPRSRSIPIFSARHGVRRDDSVRSWTAGDDDVSLPTARRRVVGQLDIGRPRRSTQYVRSVGLWRRVHDRSASGVGCPIGIPGVAPALCPMRDTRDGFPTGSRSRVRARRGLRAHHPGRPPRRHRRSQSLLLARGGEA